MNQENSSRFKCITKNKYMSFKRDFLNKAKERMNINLHLNSKKLRNNNIKSINLKK